LVFHLGLNREREQPHGGQRVTFLKSTKTEGGSSSQQGSPFQASHGRKSQLGKLCRRFGANFRPSVLQWGPPVADNQ
jgi:hypothetical protein